MKIDKKQRKYNGLQNEDPLQRYQNHVDHVRACEAQRLGYPVAGAIDHSDYDLGIVPKSILDVYLNNIGNPYDMPSSFHHHAKTFEQEVIGLCAHYLGLDPSTRGYITSGGTEGNFAGLWWAREYGLNYGTTKIMPKVWISTAAHYSISKAAHQLALDMAYIPATMRGAMDLTLLAEQLKQHPIEQAVIVVATLGTTQTGGIDDVLAIRDLIDTHIISRGGIARLHLDAALLGLALPVLFPSTYLSVLAAVDSVAISAHKLLAARMLISGIVLTSAAYLKSVFSGKKNKISYIGGLHDITVSGSRSGSAAIALHHRLTQLEFAQKGAPLRNYILESMRLAQYFYDALTQIVPREQVMLGDNQLTLVFPRPSHAAALIQTYSLMPINEDKLGVCVLSHVNQKMIDAFLLDYRSLV